MQYPIFGSDKYTEVIWNHFPKSGHIPAASDWPRTFLHPEYFCLAYHQE